MIQKNEACQTILNLKNYRMECYNLEEMNSSLIEQAQSSSTFTLALLGRYGNNIRDLILEQYG